MKKLRKLSLQQLDKAELGKRQEGLLFGGGTPGVFRCGSCPATAVLDPMAAGGREANSNIGYISSNPNGECTCPSSLIYNTMSAAPVL